MWECLVKLPSSTLLEVDLNTDTALGVDLLDEVCKRLGTIEEDFFGLQISHKHNHSNLGDRYWINLRNRLKPQLHSSSSRVDLRVKFYVEPHLILQESTRLLVFENLKQDLRDEVLRCFPDDLLASLTAHIAQATVGNCCRYSNTQLHKYYSDILPSSIIDYFEDFLNSILEQHKTLSGMKQSTAIYNALKVASECDHYGEEYHDVTVDGSFGWFGVGPKGISLYDKQWNCQLKIPYQSVLKATHKTKDFYLQTAGDNSMVKHVFKLQNSDASKAIYRSVTEMYLFYLCDTVRSDVSSQFCRDLKGTLASIFNERTELGKKFVFDIQRTLKEANDHTRRQLLRMKADSALPVGTSDCFSWLPSLVAPPGGGQGQGRDEEGGEGEESSSSGGAGGATGGKQRRHSWSSGGRQSLVEDGAVGEICEDPAAGAGGCDDDSLVCQVCMQRHLDTVFVPCGHASCCATCAARVTLCPICRTFISHKQQLFLPSSLRMRHASR